MLTQLHLSGRIYMSLYRASAVWALFLVWLAAQSAKQSIKGLVTDSLCESSKHQARLVNGVFEKHLALWRGWVPQATLAIDYRAKKQGAMRAGHPGCH